MNGGDRSIKHAATALVVGIMVGVALVTAFEFATTNKDAMVPPAAAAQAAFVLSLMYGVGIVLLSVPCWLLISKLQLDGPVAAAALGFLMTSAIWYFSNEPHFTAGFDDLAIGFSGGAAGLATWWFAKRR